jgi:hypothetical protein
MAKGMVKDEERQKFQMILQEYRQKLLMQPKIETKEQLEVVKPDEPLAHGEHKEEAPKPPEPTQVPKAVDSVKLDSVPESPSPSTPPTNVPAASIEPPLPSPVPIVDNHKLPVVNEQTIDKNVNIPTVEELATVFNEEKARIVAELSRKANEDKANKDASEIPIKVDGKLPDAVLNSENISTPPLTSSTPANEELKVPVQLDALAEASTPVDTKVNSKSLGTLVDDEPNTVATGQTVPQPTPTVSPVPVENVPKPAIPKEDIILDVAKATHSPPAAAIPTPTPPLDIVPQNVDVKKPPVLTTDDILGQTAVPITTTAAPPTVERPTRRSQLSNLMHHGHSHGDGSVHAHDDGHGHEHSNEHGHGHSHEHSHEHENATPTKDDDYEAAIPTDPHHHTPGMTHEIKDELGQEYCIDGECTGVGKMSVEEVSVAAV